MPLDEIISTIELERRPSRPPDHRAESEALAGLMEALAEATERGGADSLLQTLSETALGLCRAHSAGVSLLDEEGGAGVFRWRGAAGVWAKFLGGSMPRDMSPCGVVLDRDRPLLMSYPERHFLYEGEAPPLTEVLLVPFHHEGKAVGTVWLIAHDETRRFDAEDLRLMTRLSRFAATAFHLLLAQERTSMLTAQTARDAGLAAALEEGRRAAEALRDADRRKNEFLAMLAHELRNPLAAMHNAVNVLRLSGTRPDVSASMSGMLERQVRQMARLVDDLLDVSRITRGKIELRRQTIDLVSVLNQAVEDVRALAATLDHELMVTSPAQPIFIDGDPARLTQTIGNLLNNGCKFMNPGGVLALSLGREGNQAVIRVRDRGIGLAADQIPRIFDMFMQVNTSLERSVSGLGIGLTLVKNLVELHGGSVEARSEGMGLGSEFIVRLPVVEVGTRPQVTKRSEVTMRLVSTASRRVLIVDDNNDVAVSLATALRTKGHEVHIARDGVEALEAAARIRPDLVLLDIGLPRLNGYDTCRRIREQPWGRQLTLVAVTGWGQDTDRRLSSEAGFDDHMVKPVDDTALGRLLQSCPKRSDWRAS
ncbi:MAG TPA: ATP-binding protein [Candidatus Polarisedimenticolia bacterium]|nr:ATP-binding protein [Candidatus Polarisedimenticolia bacterium]